MLSRTAESFFWIGRATERAEYTARWTDVHYHLLLEIADWKEQTDTWVSYLERHGDLALYRELCGAVNARTAVEFLTLNEGNPHSLGNLVKTARTHARGIQDQLSSEVWHHLNDFYLQLNEKSLTDLWRGPHRLLNDIQHTCYTLDGVVGNTMMHDEGWNFYRLGKYIERASRTARLLDDPVLSKAAPELGAISEYHRCLAILKSTSAFEAYRKFFSAKMVPRKIVQFLLFHNKFPRSIRFSASAIRQRLIQLGSPTQRPEVREALRLAGQFAADLEFGSLDEIYRMGLSSFLTQVADQLEHITNHVGKAFFGSDAYADLPVPTRVTPRRPAIHLREPAIRIMKATLTVRHEFTYRYAAPISQANTIVRLAPPQHYGSQHRLDLRWHIDPPADYRHFTDAFGNLVWQLDHAQIEKDIHCAVEMRVETQACYEPDSSLMLQGVNPQDSDCMVKPEEFRQLTTLVDSSEALLYLAHRAKERELPPTELAESLMHQVHAHLRYQPGSTHVGTSASQAFEMGVGVCQDYTHVLLSLCRQSGLPARYVSGYLPGEGQMHAWVEVLLPIRTHQHLTWVAYDPTHQRRCDEHYITVAVGRDYQDIAPTSGYYVGASSNTLSASVSVIVENQGHRTPALTAQAMLQEASLSANQSQQQ